MRAQMRSVNNPARELRKLRGFDIPAVRGDQPRMRRGESVDAFANRVDAFHNLNELRDAILSTLQRGSELRTRLTAAERREVARAFELALDVGVAATCIRGRLAAGNAVTGARRG